MRYVKICPRCGRMNDELSEGCEVDGEFLGMIPATPAPDAPPPPAPAGQPQPEPEPEPPAQSACDTTCPPESAATETAACTRAQQLCGVTQRLQTLYLETDTSGRVFEIHDGDVMGQAHDTSSAQVQLDGLPGVGYVHRNHCSFGFRDNRWHVTALTQPGYTNPTFVNQQRLAPGDSCALKNGDRLSLSNVVLNVRVIEY